VTNQNSSDNNDQHEPAVPIVGASNISLGNISLVGSGVGSVISAREQIASIDTEIEALGERLASNRQVTRIFLWATIVLLAIQVVLSIIFGNSAAFIQIILGIIAFLTAVVWLSGLVATNTTNTELEALNRRKTNVLQLAGIQSASGKPSYFDQLVKINVDNLGDYYTLVKEQTNKSFYAALIVGLLGFALVLAGLAMGFVNYQNTPPVTYIASGAGVVTEFIAGVFFYLYNKTVQQLKGYHDSLLNVQNVLLSFKIVEDIQSEEQRTAMVGLMLGHILGKPGQPVSILPPAIGSTRNADKGATE
jgi:hypothetical protein